MQWLDGCLVVAVEARLGDKGRAGGVGVAVRARGLGM